MCFQPQDQLTLANSLELSFKVTCEESEGTAGGLLSFASCLASNVSEVVELITT